MPGPMELMLIMAIILLLFGGAKLPSLMRNLGRSAVEFKKGVQGVEDEVNDAVKSVEEKGADVP
ncbi:MAG: twin-arginine translocase TatA/TatE family subunit [Planctomycetaceae bacterium]|nr:twin-arginine translocase TatA/TatE family subunit [Planctomycetaceae bacterium]HAA71887.1 twin-arginine translocase TatA/TatE family subunit [Planctomycetaceae bacterium]